jgi:hypothetical protein
MDLLKTVTGKVVGGAVALGVIAAGITWWQTDPETRQRILSGTGRILMWLGIVLVAPWATFFLSARVARLESNLAGGLLVLAYSVAEVVLLAWLFDWKVEGAAQWTFVLLGFLLACVYNLFTCDWIAEKVS